MTAAVTVFLLVVTLIAWASFITRLGRIEKRMGGFRYALSCLCRKADADACRLMKQLREPSQN